VPSSAHRTMRGRNLFMARRIKVVRHRLRRKVVTLLRLLAVLGNEGRLALRLPGIAGRAGALIGLR
jgi:hypothetical protein